jgi:hypothetical protein
MAMDEVLAVGTMFERYENLKKAVEENKGAN